LLFRGLPFLQLLPLFRLDEASDLLFDSLGHAGTDERQLCEPLYWSVFELFDGFQARVEEDSGTGSAHTFQANEGKQLTFHTFSAKAAISPSR
jgi:hypothetical protein